MCTGFYKEYTSSFIELEEGGFNVETDDYFNCEIVTLIKGECDLLFHYILSHWWSVDTEK